MDEAGKVFVFEDRVFRAIYTQRHAVLFRKILDSSWIEDVFRAGLVKTWIPEDLSLDGAELVLEHQYIPFTLHPAELTAYMHWLSAKTMVRVNLALARHGLALKDAHPWNLMFHKGSPIFIDFGSIDQIETIPYSWLDEFRRYFAVPIWLSFRFKGSFGDEYRKQHLTGFGIKLFDLFVFKKIIFSSLSKLYRFYKDPNFFFAEIDKWLNAHKPKSAKKEYWASYAQSGDMSDPLVPVTPKHQFVHDVIIQEKPRKVLDCAANKGFYSEVAATLGASVISLDYEPYCIDLCLESTRKKSLDITPVMMNFLHPTPPSGLGLLFESAYHRLKSNLVLALGLAHHICIFQKIPVSIFCEICMNYAEDGIIFEFVDPCDKHVAVWKKSIPDDYSLEGFSRYFMKKFPKRFVSDMTAADGIHRVFAYYHV
jgi:hypothetical protein